MASVRIKRNDTRPTRFTVLDDSETPPAAVGGIASAVFIMNDARTGERIIDRRALTVLDSAGGVVEMAWSSSDTDQAGVFNAEIEVTYTDGTAQTFPTEGYILVTIEADLG